MTDLLSPKTLKARLAYQGRQYDNGQSARGGHVSAPHMLLQAVDRIEALENELAKCQTDYAYLRTVAPDAQGLHSWLTLREKATKTTLGDAA